MCTGLEGLALIQGASAIAGGFAESQAGKAQEMLAQGQAAGERDVARASAQRIREQTGRTQGAARAALAGAGVDVSRGSSLDIDRDIGTRGERDALMALLSGERNARETEAAGRQARLRGRSALGQSVVGAVGTMAASRWRSQPAATRNVNNYSPFLEGGNPMAGP